MIKSSSFMNSDFYFSRTRNNSRSKPSTPRTPAVLHRISLSRGSPKAFMLLSTPKSYIPKIHAKSPSIIKSNSYKSGLKIRSTFASDKDLRIVATKININLKYSYHSCE